MFWDWTGALWDAYLSGLGGAAAIEAKARARLAGLVRGARLGSPFYARHLHGLSDTTPLPDLPPVTRRALMADFDEWAIDRAVTRRAVDAFLTDPQRLGRPFLGRYAAWTSSGSTGEMGIYLHDEQALAVYDALELVRFRGLGPLQWPGAACLAGERYALITATGGHFAAHATAARLANLNPWLADHLRVFTIMQPLPDLVAALRRYEPSLLATYPTVAEMLADERAAGRLPLRLRELWCGGEHLSPALRAHLEHCFGCRVREAYGASEFLPIAWDCGQGALHVNSDWVLVEPVDARGQPAAPGRPSYTTLITNLANRVQPLIRYDIGDRVTPLRAPCPCGSPFPAIHVEGRCNDTLALRDARGHTVHVPPLALATAIEEDAGVVGFQLAQTGPATIELRLDPAAAGDPAAPARCVQALIRLLGAQGLGEVRIEWKGRPPQRDAASGKLRQVLSALGPVRARARPLQRPVSAGR